MGADLEPAETPGLEFSLLLSPSLEELLPIWDIPEVVGALLMMEGRKSSAPVERASFMQMMGSKEKSLAQIEARLRDGVTVEDVIAGWDPAEMETIRIDYSVDYIVDQIDSSTIRIDLTHSRVDEKSSFGPEGRVSVVASNRGNEIHNYSVVSISRSVENQRAAR